jgi:YegS/Rv2252/BmrU family lipid kinase
LDAVWIAYAGAKNLTVANHSFIIIANPTSGARAAPTLATRVSELLKAQGADVQLRVTTARGDATRFASEAAAAKVTACVACGGDGTLQEVASSLEGTQTALGILPGGRCNDFAHALGLSKNDSPERLSGVLLANQRRAVDLGAWNGKRFLTVATLGFDSEVSRFVETRNLWLKGTASYLYAAACVLPRFKFPLVRIKGDFGNIEGHFLLAATANSSCYGGAMHIAPAARIDDGLFHLCVIDRVSRWTVLRILPRVLKGKHVEHPAVKILTTASVEIETPEGPQWICADGESLGQTPCRFEIKKGALQVLAGN